MATSSDSHNPAASSPRSDSCVTSSGIDIDVVYGAGDHEDLGQPGEFPFARGAYAGMYRDRPWTIRQYAGYGTANETNARFKALLAAGQTGLSIAFDLPTQMGLDSDAPLAVGEVGRVGVAIDTLDDMRTLFTGLPLDQVTTSMTINSTAAILLLLYQIVAEEQGVDPSAIRGTVQNDILKEYIARGTYVYPPEPSMRLVTDLISYCGQELPQWNTISISGYHMREAGCTAAQEIAFTLANAIAYVEAVKVAGADVNEFGQRLSFFWIAHNNLFEEAAKFRAARRMWATIMRDRLGATDPSAQRMRFHTQTAGSTLTAQQPQNNIMRTTVQALAAVLGGTQSLHTNAFDEALGLPTEQSATLAVRTQQLLANESGATDTVDPLAGSYYVEYLTDQLERKATALIEEIDDRGGAVAAINEGVQQEAIAEAAYQAARRIETGDDVVVGVNAYGDEEDLDISLLTVDPSLEARQVERLVAFRARRDVAAVDAALDALSAAAQSSTNILFPLKATLLAGATVGEASDTLRNVFGSYQAP